MKSTNPTKPTTTFRYELRIGKLVVQRDKITLPGHIEWASVRPLIRRMCAYEGRLVFIDRRLNGESELLDVYDKYRKTMLELLNANETILKLEAELENEKKNAPTPPQAPANVTDEEIADAAAALEKARADRAKLLGGKK